MRSFRNAAVAGISAVAITLSSTAVASAQTTDAVTVAEHPAAPAPEGKSKSKGSSPSSDANEFLGLDGDQPADGTALFGSSKEGFGDQPSWAKLLYAGTVITGVGAVLGAIIAPIYNFFTHGL
ncbi:hypothetical protein NYP18_13770 [Corynebacterium sp. YIM 101645]|uniref:Or membrane protein n=1 Tax=Corynebacterium lemuris TaxID=1859292 RepID=A0ABT2FZP8_9CORY|nr:hypothetical protein [Corynebacterium lemuris]MCS5480713.1 hypothetical protein [Corynebacterium lemuris]